MDNLILGPTDFDMEKLLLLEARVYELLSELLLFVLSLNPKCIRHSYGIALHRKHCILCQMNLSLNSLCIEGLQQVSPP